ncbi:hypothetical protein MKW98_007966 [Papaver atlanticum]|uniref:Uncharacterized protein n=1 Tax=Papaver atlanticum TaxID=357466 RepID=A0AAD4S8A9_9MAGN|nr:hypothetical protein MKW98_007966 [Papaver atlanticum]
MAARSAPRAAPAFGHRSFFFSSSIAKTLSSCSSNTGDFNNYQLSNEEINALRKQELNEQFFKALSRVQEIHANCKILLRTHRQQAGLELMDMMAVYQEGAYERLCSCSLVSGGCSPGFVNLVRSAYVEGPSVFRAGHEEDA